MTEWRTGWLDNPLLTALLPIRDERYALVSVLGKGDYRPASGQFGQALFWQKGWHCFCFVGPAVPEISRLNFGGLVERKRTHSQCIPIFPGHFSVTLSDLWEDREENGRGGYQRGGWNGKNACDWGKNTNTRRRGEGSLTHRRESGGFLYFD